MVEAAHWQWVATKQGGKTQLSQISCCWLSYSFLFLSFFYLSGSLVMLMLPPSREGTLNEASFPVVGGLISTEGTLTDDL